MGSFTVSIVFLSLFHTSFSYIFDTSFLKSFLTFSCVLSTTKTKNIFYIQKKCTYWFLLFRVVSNFVKILSCIITWVNMFIWIFILYLWWSNTMVFMWNDFLSLHDVIRLYRSAGGRDPNRYDTSLQFYKTICSPFPTKPFPSYTVKFHT